MGSGYRWQLGQESGGGSLAVGKGRPSPWKGKPEGGTQGGTGQGLWTGPQLAAGKLLSEDWVPASCQRRADGFSWRPGPRAPSDSCVPSPGCRINSCSRTSYSEWPEPGPEREGDGASLKKCLPGAGTLGPRPT